ncbi:MAG: epoxyqueuosine reductase QueH [Clostridiales bacterium]|nr:epoxyqueuosine reductase QueH [Clostridiales bacterium]
MEDILLHSCCGPCSLYPLEELRREGFSVYGYFANPNIHPYREFQARLQSYRNMADQEDLVVRIEESYGLAEFLEALRGMDAGVYQPLSAERCRLCYRLRMRSAARACREAGLTQFTSSLLVSPYQDHAGIVEAGERAAGEYGLTFLYRDFRPGFRRGQAKAKEMGLYLQGYCGCVFSEYERYGETKKGK